MSFFDAGQNAGLQGGLFSSPGPLSLNDLNKGQQQQQQSQQQPSGGLFGQQSQQQFHQQQQPQQQQQGGLFGSSGSGQQQQPQPQQPSQFGGFDQPFPNQQQQTTQTVQGQATAFGKQAFGSQSQQPQQQQPYQALGQQQQPQQQQFANQQYMQIQQQQQPNQAFQQQQPLQQQQPQPQMSYVPGYLSRVRGDKPYRSPARQTEPGSPEKGEAEISSGFGTPASKSTKDDASSSRNQSSPVGRFSSSFFNERRGDDSDGLGRSGSVGPGAWRGGRESIFGAGGLRGNRKSMTPAPSSGGINAPDTPASRMAAGDSSFSPSRSFRAATSPPGGRSSSFAAATMDDDDDDAPPQEMLDDVKPSSPTSALYGNSSFSSFGAGLGRRSSGHGGGMGGGSALSGAASSVKHSHSNINGGNGATEQLTGRAAVLDKAQRTVLIYGYPHWMEKAVLELFAGIGGVELIEPIDITGSGSAQDQAQANPTGPFLPCCTRFVYEASFQALHALRRNGEIVAGACIVGVRWEDENFHQISLTNGVDAVFRKDMVPSSRTKDIFRTSSKPLSIPSTVDGSALGGGGVGAGAGYRSSLQLDRSHGALSSSPSPGANHSGSSGGGGGAASHAYGRPLSVVSGSSAAIRGSPSFAANLAGTPFRVPGSFFSNNGSDEAPAGGQNKAEGAPYGTAGATQAQAQTQLPRDKSVMGRIADGIFGW